jgi:hypothetical protein
MELVAQIVLVNTMMLCRVNPLAGTTTNGCVDHLAVAGSCAGSQNQWGHTTVIEPNFPTQCY